jgi:hypothetical protein
MSDKLAEAQAALARAVTERSRARAELDAARAARARAREGTDPGVYDVARKKQALAFQAYLAAYEEERRARQKVRRDAGRRDLPHWPH